MFNLMPEKYTAEQQMVLANVNLIRCAINEIERRTKNAYTGCDEVKSMLKDAATRIMKSLLEKATSDQSKGSGSKRRKK